MGDGGMSIRVGPEGTGDPVRDGIGCLLTAIAVMIMWWAMVGFPGLVNA